MQTVQEGRREGQRRRGGERSELAGIEGEVSHGSVPSTRRTSLALWSAGRASQTYTTQTGTERLRDNADRDREVGVAGMEGDGSAPSSKRRKVVSLAVGHKPAIFSPLAAATDTDTVSQRRALPACLPACPPARLAPLSLSLSLGLSISL